MPDRAGVRKSVLVARNHSIPWIANGCEFEVAIPVPALFQKVLFESPRVGVMVIWEFCGRLYIAVRVKCYSD